MRSTGLPLHENKQDMKKTKYIPLKHDKIVAIDRRSSF